MEANLAAIAAALAAPPPAGLGVKGKEVKVKAFSDKETDGHASDEEVGDVAAAVDADIDDEACETLLGREEDMEDSRGAFPRGPSENMKPLGRMTVDDGLDSASEDEMSPPMHKSGSSLATPKRPEVHESPETSAPPQPPAPLIRGKENSLAGMAATPQTAPKIPSGPAKGSSLAEVDLHLTRSLDRFFASDFLWQQVSAEMSKRPKLASSLEALHVEVPTVRRQFKVQVPEPYPGIQYRRSKVLTDRYTRYAKHGTVVAGHLEDGGEWLRVADNVFLPVKVGAIAILKAVQPDGEISSPFANSTDAAARTAGARTSPAGGHIVSLNNSQWCNGCEPSGAPCRNNETASGGMGVSGHEPFESNDIGEVVVPDDSVSQGLLLNTPQGEFGGAIGVSVLRTVDLDSRLNNSIDGVGGNAFRHSGPLSHLDEASRLLSGSEPINPFTDTPRGGSPNTTPLKMRHVSDPTAVPINPFSDTPPGGNSPRATPLRTRPQSRG